VLREISAASPEPLGLFSFQPKVERPAWNENVDTHRGLHQRVLHHVRFVPGYLHGIALIEILLVVIGLDD